MQHLILPARPPVGRPAGPFPRWLRSLPAALLALLGLLVSPGAWATDITSCPYTISQPGSYTVTQDLSCSGSAISITASNVTLSLGGHTLTGPGRTQFQAAAIIVGGGSGVSISSGTISSFGIAVDLEGGGTSVSGLAVTNCDDGIEIEFGASGNTISGIGISNSDVGIAIGGPGNTITNNTSNGNETGISINDPTATGNLVEANTALNNSSVDLEDVTTRCDSNTWRDNCFGTESQSCIGISTCGGTSPITCPSNVSVTAAAGQTSATVDVGTATTTPPGLPVVGMREDNKALTDPYPVGVTMIHWTVNPGQASAATCIQTITVQPASGPLPPPLTCPGNKNVTAVLGKNDAAVDVGMATSSDSEAAIVGVRSDGKPLTAPYPVGTTTITWVATDVTTATCTQTITVQPAYFFTAVVIGPASADPHVESIVPDRGPLNQRAIIHGSGFADVQGTSYILLGGHQIPVLTWTSHAIGISVNPLGFNQAPLALNAAYPVQVVTPAAGKRSNTVDFFLTDATAADYPNPAVSGPSDQPSLGSFQRTLFCPGDTVTLLGAGFGPAQGTGYVSVSVPLMDSNGHVVRQEFAEPVLAWSENAIHFALLLPAGAIPGTYTATVHRGNGKSVSGSFTVGARVNGACVAGAS